VACRFHFSGFFRLHNQAPQASYHAIATNPGR
jgi:hypothetical protein